MNQDDNKSLGIQNQTSNPAPESTLISPRGLVSPVEKVISAIKEIKQSQAINSKAAETMIGVVLMTSPPLSLSVDSFAAIYPKDTSFFKSVVQKDGKAINPKKDASVIRAYCYIPEISGCLPLPDLKKLYKFLTLWNESERPQVVGSGTSDLQEQYDAKREKSIIKMYPDLYKEFKKVVMHPIFYKYVERPITISPFQFVSLNFTKDFDTYHTGVIGEVYGDFLRVS